MNVRQTFKLVGNFARYFLLRWDIWILAFGVSVVLYSTTFIASFLLLTAGLGDFIGEKTGVVDTGWPYVGTIEAHMALNLGIILLGVAAVASIVSVYISAQAVTNFGAALVLKFHDRWDDLKKSDRQAILTTAIAATTYGRLVLNTLTPVAMFVFGVGYLATYNPWVGAIVLLLGSASILVFIPVDSAAKHMASDKFDVDTDGKTLVKERSVLRAYLVQSLDMYLARRFIGAANIGILFLIFGFAFYFLGPEFIVGLFNEQTLLVIILIRSSILSLNRMTICLRVARKRLSAMLDILAITRYSQVPKGSKSGGVGQDDEEEF